MTDQLKGRPAKTNNTVQAFWVALGSFSSFGLSIVSAAILSRFLDKTGYGSYKQILYVYTTLLFVFTAGLPKVFSYFLPRYSLQEGKAIVWKVSRLLFLFGALFSLFLFLFSTEISKVLGNKDLEMGLKFFSPVPMLLLPTLGIEGIFSTYKKTKYIAIYNTLSRLFTLLCIVAPVIFLNGTYLEAIKGWSIASFITLLLALYFKGIPFKGIKTAGTSLRYKNIFSYSLPLVVASAWSVALRSADQFYISKYFGADVFAEFSNGFIPLPFVTMITASTTIVLMPVFSKTFQHGYGIEDLMKTWRSTLRKSALLIYPLVVFFMFYSTEVMVILYSESYAASGLYFQISMFLNFFNIIIFGPLFFASGRTKIFANVHMFLAALMWVSSYFVVYLFESPIAVAVNSTLINILKIIILVFLASKFMKVGFLTFFPVRYFAKIILQCCLILLMIKFFETSLQLPGNSLYRLILTFIIYGILVLCSAPVFRVNYISVLNPLYEKLKRK